MNIRLKMLTLATAANLLVLPASSLPGQTEPTATGATRAAFVIPETESFRTRAVALEGSSKLRQERRAEQPGPMYSFMLHGTARPGVVAIEVLDSSGTVVERTTGRLTGMGGEGQPRQANGQRQWKPVNFKVLGFTTRSVVAIDKLVEGTRLTITGEKGWVIVATLRKLGKKG